VFFLIPNWLKQFPKFLSFAVWLQLTVKMQTKTNGFSHISEKEFYPPKKDGIAQSDAILFTN